MKLYTNNKTHLPLSEWVFELERQVEYLSAENERLAQDASYHEWKADELRHENRELLERIEFFETQDHPNKEEN